MTKSAPGLDQRRLFHRKLWENKEAIRIPYRDYHGQLLKSRPEGAILIALFFAIGLGNPDPATRQVPSRPRLVRYGSTGLIVAAALFVCLPWMAHRLFLTVTGATAGNGLAAKPDEAFVFGGRRMSGFLVVDDDMPLRSDVPTLHLADFEAIIAQSAVESDQGLLAPVAPPF